MRKARFTEHQIIAVLKSVEAGRTVKDVRVAGSGRAIPTIRFSGTFSGSEAARTPVESQKDPPYLLSAETEFSP